MFMLKSFRANRRGRIGALLLPEGADKDRCSRGTYHRSDYPFSLTEYRRIRAQEQSIENNLNAILDKISRLPPEQASHELITSFNIGSAFE